MGEGFLSVQVKVIFIVSNWNRCVWVWRGVCLTKQYIIRIYELKTLIKKDPVKTLTFCNRPHGKVN